MPKKDNINKSILDVFDNKVKKDLEHLKEERENKDKTKAKAKVTEPVKSVEPEDKRKEPEVPKNPATVDPEPVEPENKGKDPDPAKPIEPADPKPADPEPKKDPVKSEPAKQDQEPKPAEPENPEVTPKQEEPKKGPDPDKPADPKPADPAVSKSTDIDTYLQGIKAIQKSYEVQSNYAEQNVKKLECLRENYASLNQSINELKELVSKIPALGVNGASPEEATQKSVSLEDKADTISKSVSSEDLGVASRNSGSQVTDDVINKSTKPVKPVTAQVEYLHEQADDLQNDFVNRMISEHSAKKIDDVKLRDLSELQKDVQYGTADKDEYQQFIDYAKAK